MEYVHSLIFDVYKNIYIEQWNRLEYENEDFVQNMNLLHFWYLNYELEVAVNKKWMFLLMERINSEKWKKILKKKNKKAPTGGLEPPTTRLRAWRSTDWARRACILLYFMWLYKTDICFLFHFFLFVT